VEEKPLKIEKELQVLAFPNPANNSITFKMVDAEQKNSCQISLFDIRGEKLLNFKLDETETQKTISLESLSSGVYFYRAEDSEKVIQTNKLIIIK
jgi:hypothetical protein